MALVPEEPLVVDYSKSTETVFQEVLSLVTNHFTALTKEWFKSPRPANWEDEEIAESTLAVCIFYTAAISECTCHALELHQKSDEYSHNL